MATFAQIKTVRLTIHDPLNFIDILEVADVGSLPVTPAPQTAYTIALSGIYQRYTTSWANIVLNISDSLLSTYIDTYGVDKAAIKALENIVHSIGSQIGVLSQIGTGSENTTYVNLTTLYNFYKSVIKDMKDEIAVNTGSSTGCFVSMPAVQIGGVYEDEI